jgi:hypothetical protein
METVRTVFNWLNDGGRIYFVIPILSVLVLYLVFLWQMIKEGKGKFPVK